VGKQAPGKVKFTAKDYPLERECNAFVPQDLHSARVRRRSRCGSPVKKARPKRWKTGSTRISRDESDTVRKAAASIGGITDFDGSL
jgi:hypothetical protein